MKEKNPYTTEENCFEIQLADSRKLKFTFTIKHAKNREFESYNAQELLNKEAEALMNTMAKIKQENNCEDVLIIYIRYENKEGGSELHINNESSGEKYMNINLDMSEWFITNVLCFQDDNNFDDTNFNDQLISYRDVSVSGDIEDGLEYTLSYNL